MKAVILAGGKGRRLLPYTTNFPKPLMPIGDRPILEIIIGQLKAANIDDVIICTGHLEELIRAFFLDGSKYGVRIAYSKEDQPLGTAGPLNLVRDRLDDTFLVMNGDVLSDVDFGALLKYHRSKKAAATIGLCQRSVDIDFGVVTIDTSDAFVSWKEKPRIEYLVSMGIYLFEPEVLHVMPKTGVINLPDLVLLLSQNQKEVCGYVHRGYWLDIGRGEDYERACRDHERANGA
jgi:NDP-mannose synthase